MSQLSDHPDQLRRLLVALPLVNLVGACARKDTTRALTVYKTPYCGCCKGWVTHMTRAGFIPKVIEVEDLTPIRDKHGIPFSLSSCHTGIIGGYVVEGHVPPEDVVKLLETKPKAVGITVQGMPFGSPGMEQPNGVREPFNTLLLLDRSGRTQVFAKHV